MQCSRCRHENRPNVKFCGECGARLEALCPSCRTSNPPTNKFCDACGQPLGRVAAESRFSSPHAYTPKHLAEKILTSKAGLEGERKQVTVLFADLKGSMELLADRDPEEARALLDPVLERMMEAVHHYEGTVNQVMGDGIMALFGAPLAHEDHAVRACYAALRMQESVKRYAEELQRTAGVPIHIRVGLNAGEVVVRSIGSDLRMDYTAVGQTTHLAARMEQLATPGTIRLTAEALRLAEGYVQVKPLGPVPVKGVADPVEVYEVTGAGVVRTRFQAAAARGLTRFVGRDAELDQLGRSLQLAAEGHGQVVAVVGEAGVGKSRLFYELTRSHRTQGWLVLESGSISYGKATSYLPVIELLKAYFKIQDRDDVRKIREKVSGKLITLDEGLMPTLAAFMALLDVPVDDPQWGSLDPRQRRQRTLDACKRLVLRESQVQPLLLVFEDLHWIDSEAQAFLDSLVDSLPTARLLLLVNYRPEYEHGWSRKTYYTQLRIDPLPPKSAGALLDALLGHDRGLASLARLLIERTEGNPFFLEESVWTLVETEVLTGDRGAYRLARPIEAVQVPETVQAVLTARIDRLLPEDKQLLQAASVIGKDVPFVLLQAITDLPEDELRRELGYLRATEFLYETSLFPDLEYTFKHAMTLEVAYGSLLRDRRRGLHVRVLEALERLFADRATERVELLAHHAVRGEQWHPAARYLYLAGERGLAYGAYKAAASFYAAAIDALERQGEAHDRVLKLDACLELWVAALEMGQLKDLPALAEKAEALAIALNNPGRLAQVRVRQAQAHWWFGGGRDALDSAIQRAQEASRLADPRDLRTRSYAGFVVAAACRDLGRFGEAIRAFEAGAALLTDPAAPGEPPGLVLPIYVTIRAVQAETHAARGEFPVAIAVASDGVRMANQIAHASSIALANALLGYVLIQKGDVEAALSVLEQGLAIGEENGFIHAIVANALYLGYGLVLRGRPEAGLTQLARGIRAAAPTGYNITPWSRYGIVTASTYLAADRLPDAKAEVARGLALVAERNARGHRAPLVRLHAEILSRQDPRHGADAVRYWEEARVLAADLGMRPELAHCHLGLGTLYRRTDRRDQAREHLTIATTMYREMDMGFWLEQAQKEMKKFEEADGD